MTKDTKKIKEDYTSELHTWKDFIRWLANDATEDEAKACMLFEIRNQNRPAFIDRARTRFNKLRAKRELKDIEKVSGKTINV